MHVSPWSIKPFVHWGYQPRQYYDSGARCRTTCSLQGSKKIARVLRIPFHGAFRVTGADEADIKSPWYDVSNRLGYTVK